VAAIIEGAPVDLVDLQKIASTIAIAERPSMQSSIDRFNAGVKAMDGA